MALNPAQIYDPRYHTFESWASRMCELYGAQNLEIPNALTDWKKCLIFVKQNENGLTVSCKIVVS